MAKKGSRAAKSPTAKPRPAASPPGRAALARADQLEPGGRPGWRDDPRRFLYAGFDLLSAIGYVYAFATLVQNRFGWARGVLYILPAAAIVMMIGTLVGRRAGWWVTIAGGVAMLLWTVGMIVVLLTTAAYLSGVYGAFGKAAATSTVLSTAFIVQFAATLPILQLKWSMTRAGRRSFGLAPLWPGPTRASAA